MFSALREFISRHRRKLIVGGLFIGGAAVLSQYAQRTLRQYHETETKEFLERNQKLQHYESIQRTCNETALKMAPSLKETIIRFFKTDELIERLKMGAPEKLTIWMNLNILSFTKISTLVYTSSMLMVALRIQLNLIGGYMFLDYGNDPEPCKITTEIQKKYLTLCNFVNENKLTKLCNIIQEKVTLIVGDKSLKMPVTIRDIEQIFWAIQSGISSDPRDPCKFLPEYILPEEAFVESAQSESTILDKMIRETQDLLESEEIIYLIRSCVSQGFHFVMDHMTDYFRSGNPTNVKNGIKKDESASMGQSDDASAVVDLEKISIPLAKIIPLVNGLVPSTSNKDDFPHLWMQQLMIMDSLNTMGANVYETFSFKGK